MLGELVDRLEVVGLRFGSFLILSKISFLWPSLPFSECEGVFGISVLTKVVDEDALKRKDVSE